MVENDEPAAEGEPDTQSAVREVIDDVLTPLLVADGGVIELLGMDSATIQVKVSGNAAFGVGCTYVRTHVIEPAIREVAPEHKVEFELAVPPAVHRA